MTNLTKLSIEAPSITLAPAHDNGQSEIYIGDCLQVMRALVDRGVRVDSVVTDPPYSSGTRMEASKGTRKAMTRGMGAADWFGNDALTAHSFVWMMRECALLWRDLLVPGGHALVFIDWRMAPHLAAAIESADLKHCGVLVWNKTYFGMGSCFRNQHEFVLHFTNGTGNPPQRRDIGNVLSCKPVRNGDHPTEKPAELLGCLIEVVTPPGGLVLDPFAGSGSTLSAALAGGFRAIGIERETGYLDAIKKRVSP
jgi:site-specific DNA-methyltransferase (adenine-specific)